MDVFIFAAGWVSQSSRQSSSELNVSELNGCLEKGGRKVGVQVRCQEKGGCPSSVRDLFSRQIVGWSMQSRMQADLVLKALVMAVWKRKPAPGLLIHSDQGSQYTGHEWQKFIDDHKLECSMSRRGNCHDNAVAESFFQLLKRERIKRRIYATRDEARADVFDYIELFYNRRRRHSSNDGLSPVEYEKAAEKRLKSV